MAQQVNVSFVDDLDGGEAEGTVSFALDGRTYEIDLSRQNVAKLRDIVAPYVDAGRKTSGATRTPRRVSNTSSDREHNQAIREWAQAQGLTVSTRGRLSSEALEAYEARNEVPAVEAPASVEPAKQSRRKSKVSKVPKPTFSGVPA